MATRISIASRKGGVGKTTAAIEIATNLQLIGKKTLLVDFDPQGDSTRSVGADSDYNNIYQAISVEVNVTECIQKTDFFDLISSSAKLGRVSKEFTERDDIFLLDEVLKIIEDNYDYIIIDNNPDLGDLFIMSMVASDYVIIPTLADENSMQSVRETEQVLQKLTNGRLGESHAKVLGYILSRKKRASLHTLMFDELQSLAEEKDYKPFVCWVTDGVKMDETKTYRTPISILQKGSTQAREFYAIAQEIIERTEKEVS